MQFQSGEWADVPSVQVSRAQPQQVPRKLSVVIPFIQSEVELVTKLLNRSIELCGQIPRAVFLVPFKGLKTDEILSLAQKAFANVGVISDAEGITSDWQEGLPMRSAAGPNSLFRQAAWFFYLQKRFAAWLWMEPDCTPITDRWLFELEQEYFEMDRPFLGVKMKIGDGREYMNGVGIYPWNAIQFAPLLVQSAMWQQHPEFEVGFDVAGGADVLNKAHMTRKIQLELRKRDDFSVRPETVLIHGRNNDLGANGAEREASTGRDELPHETRPQEPLSVGLSGGQGVTDVKPSSPPAQKPHITEQLKTAIKEKAMIESFPVLPQTKQDDSEYGAVSKQINPDYINASHVALIAHPNAPTFQDQLDDDFKAQYGLVSKAIRQRVDDLVKLWNGSPSRKVLIVKELRKSKLVPKHFR